MNPVIILQKLFGSKQTKIKAIGFEIEKLQDEVRYKVELFNKESHHDIRNYYEIQLDILAERIQSKHLEIEVLHNG